MNGSMNWGDVLRNFPSLLETSEFTAETRDSLEGF